jgi:hypothetical protein
MKRFVDKMTIDTVTGLVALLLIAAANVSYLLWVALFFIVLRTLDAKPDWLMRSPVGRWLVRVAGLER